MIMGWHLMDYISLALTVRLLEMIKVKITLNTKDWIKERIKDRIKERIGGLNELQNTKRRHIWDCQMYKNLFLKHISVIVINL